MDTPKAILLFDGCCNLCNASVRFISRNDKRGSLRFVSLQSAEAGKLLNETGLTDHENGTVILLYSGKTYISSDASLMVFRILGRGWRLLYVFIIVPRFIRDGIYHLVSKTRYRLFGRSDACQTT